MLCSALLLSSILLTGIIVVSCVRQESLDLKENAAEQLEIIEAKQWFEERMYSENYLTGESEMLLYKEWIPRWSEAKLQQLSENKIVEVPLMFKKFRATIAQEVFKLYEETKDPRYLLVDIKLIIEKDSATGEMKDLIREIIPSLDYLQSQDFDPACLFRADEFSGAVKYYTPDWQFVYAHIYENGEIVGNLVKAEPETRSAGGFLCYEIITVIPVNWYLNDMVDGDYITTTYQYSVSIECYYSSGAGGGGDGGNGNGNGSNFDQVGENNGGGGNGNGQNQTNQGLGNFNLTDDKSKETIPRVTNYLLADCVGRKLVSEIESLNISFVYNKDHQYPASYNQNKTITWESISQFSMFEELFHAYQDKMGYIKRDSNGKIINMKNMEVEAKLALYQYVVKIGATSGLSQRQLWQDAFDPYIANPTTANYQKMLDFLSNFQLFGYEYANKTELSSTRTTNNATTILNCQN